MITKQEVVDALAQSFASKVTLQNLDSLLSETDHVTRTIRGSADNWCEAIEIGLRARADLTDVTEVPFNSADLHFSIVLLDCQVAESDDQRLWWSDIESRYAFEPGFLARITINHTKEADCDTGMLWELSLEDSNTPNEDRLCTLIMKKVSAELEKKGLAKSLVRFAHLKTLAKPQHYEGGF